MSPLKAIYLLQNPYPSLWTCLLFITASPLAIILPETLQMTNMYLLHYPFFCFSTRNNVLWGLCQAEYTPKKINQGYSAGVVTERVNDFACCDFPCMNSCSCRKAMWSSLGLQNWQGLELLWQWRYTMVPHNRQHIPTYLNSSEQDIEQQSSLGYSTGIMRLKLQFLG